MHAVLQAVMERISREVDGLDEETMQLHPSGQAYAWNMQQILEHLALTYRETTRNLEAHLAKGRITRKQKRSVVQWALQLMVLSFGHLPGGAPPLEETLPNAGLFPARNGRGLAELLRRELEAMDCALDRCRRKFGMERVAVHPMLGALRVDQWRRLHTVYGANRLEQLLRVREQVAAPAGNANVRLVKELPIPGSRSLT